jgi:nucleoside-diphosphate-sugar epimerase
MPERVIGMKRALIGYTGFVGGNLARQTQFSHLFNSQNICEAAAHRFELVVCAAPAAEKWKANLKPAADKQKIDTLTTNLREITTRIFVQISTVDVYARPWGVDEDSAPGLENLHAYGKHRLALEEFVRRHFEHALIVRLPALFGHGLKKNVIFDLLHGNRLDLTDRDSTFQFYDLKNLWHGISIAVQHAVPLLNVTSEPMTAHEVASRCFGIDFENKTEKPPVRYDVRSKYDHLFNGANGYLYSREQTTRALKAFVAAHRRGRR